MPPKIKISRGDSRHMLLWVAYLLKERDKHNHCSRTSGGGLHYRSIFRPSILVKPKFKKPFFEDFQRSCRCPELFHLFCFFSSVRQAKKFTLELCVFSTLSSLRYDDDVFRSPFVFTFSGSTQMLYMSIFDNSSSRIQRYVCVHHPSLEKSNRLCYSLDSSGDLSDVL